MKLTPHKFASLTKTLNLDDQVEVVTEFTPEAGMAVVVGALDENTMYPDLEMADGTYSKVNPGDVFVGVLGSRQALRGFVGYSPLRVEHGEILHLLNMGGVIGRFVDGHPDLGEAIKVKLLGAVARDGKPVTLKDVALPEVDVLENSKPVILVAGSCMHVGKTAAAVELVKELTRSGLKVAVAKVSGVGCSRDTLKMEAVGAVKSATFVDCGLPSTVDADNLSKVAKSLASHLSDHADVVLMELGDGLFGHYHVSSVLEDSGFMGHVAAVVYSASDLMSAWGGIQWLKERGIKVTALTGPVTDTIAGTEYVEHTLGVPAANAVLRSEKLKTLVLKRLPVTA